ncbi:hypothetical protein I350_08265 [Cryptococcus amylolentus CBS 6273]|uniref:Uncharacterized protein n=1 Tax=Cryptococcus amylolentus CBS 6273 TaxID=1296118 RepID=A0A1E3J5U4_9TREE|nr:hypothetical protein I350_08265 [Cryptococcus amylolentus CBS 6273]
MTSILNPFGLALQNISLSLSDDFDSENKKFDGYGWDRDLSVHSKTEEYVTYLFQTELSSALWPSANQKTSLTLHNARPEEFEAKLADTMVYELPRETVDDDEWMGQMLLAMDLEMANHIIELDSLMRLDDVTADKRPTAKPWKICLTNLAPIPSDVDICRAALTAYSCSRDRHSQRLAQLFRKWWHGVVSFEGPAKCECCEVFGKGHPRITV